MISRWIEIVCDLCHTGTGDLTFDRAPAARRAARADGWVRTPNGRDLCPKCVAKIHAQINKPRGVKRGR